MIMPAIQSKLGGLRLLTILWRTGLLLLAASLLHAGPCVSDTLANYILLPPAGCTVAGLSFSNFSFAVASSGGGASVIGAAAINVTPTFGNTFGLNFTSSGWSVTGAEFVNYVIGYTEDPEGDIRSLDDVLDDPVTIPGVGRIDTLGCLEGAFSPTCPTSTVSVSVFDDGIAPQLMNRVTFPGVHVLGVQHTISLDGHGTGSVKINGYGGSSLLPEPSTGWLAVPALVLILARQAGLKRLQVLFQRRP